MDRDKSIDILKGIGILFVIIAHMGDCPLLLKAWIYSFHMPLFFFISGYLYNNKYENMNLKEFIKIKSEKLLYPYITISIFYIFYNFTIEKNINILLKRIISAIYSAKIFDINYVGAIWFITCLFSVEIIFFIIKKYKIVYINRIILIIALIGGIYPKLSNFRLPFGLDIAFVGILFYYIGYKLKSSNNIFEKIIKYRSILLLNNILLMLINYKVLKNTLFNGRVDMLYMNYGILIIFYIDAISGILYFYSISRNIKSNILVFIGKNSLMFMAFHLIIIPYAIILANKLMQLIGYNNIVVNNILYLIITLVLNSILIVVVKKYFPQFIGLRKIRNINM